MTRAEYDAEVQALIPDSMDWYNTGMFTDVGLHGAIFRLEGYIFVAFEDGIARFSADGRQPAESIHRKYLFPADDHLRAALQRMRYWAKDNDVDVRIPETDEEEDGRYALIFVTEEGAPQTLARSNDLSELRGRVDIGELDTRADTVAVYSMATNERLDEVVPDENGDPIWLSELH